MQLFVSYTKEDELKVRQLVEGLRLLRHEVWLDEELTGGQAWWNAILDRIRSSDAFVFALSPTAVDSQACMREREYAVELGKPVLPVMVERLAPELLPPDLAVVQLVDFTSSRQEVAFLLARAVSMLSPSPPPPDPLPTPPPVPLSYLSDLSRRVHAPTLTLDEQLALTARLKAALQRTAERMPAIELVRKLQQREDLYYAAAKELQPLSSLIDSFRSDAEQSMSEDIEDSSKDRQEAVPYSQPSEPHSATDIKQEWQVEVLRKDDQNRSLSITRQDSNQITYETVTSKTPNFERLSINEQVVEETKPWSAWKSDWEFIITDGDDTLPVKIHVSRTTWAARITFFSLIVQNRQIYQDSG
jgi:hypothetical protein